ncbi:MAG: hypothetical protein ISS19_08060 [Bacteroidales bacterium]|nr:hypothetical protein [Bacteroidales bacterium]
MVLILSQQHIDSQEYWIPFTRNNLWGIKDGKGSIISPARWDSIILDNPVYEYFDDLILYQDRGKFGIINIKGKDVLEPEWDAIYFNPGLSYDYNVTKNYQTESGHRTISYLSIADLEYNLSRSYSSFPIYYIVTRKNDDIFLFDKNFNKLIPEPVSNIFLETDMFVDFGLIILEKRDKMGIMYKSGKKFSGFQYDSVSFWHTDDHQWADDHCYLKIDEQIVRYSVKGKFDHNQVNLIISDCIGQILPYSDTRSWIYDFTVENNNVLVTDGNSNVYCFSAEKELHWIKEIPDVYSYTPVSSAGRIIIGNYVFKKSNMMEDPEILPGKSIQHPIVRDEYIVYIAETDPSPEFESTEIPGLQDIDPSMMGSDKKLICYNLNNQNVIWNRSLDKNYPANMPFQIFREKIIIPIFGPPEDPGYYILIFDMDNGLEQSRFKFEVPQNIQVHSNIVYLSTYCSPDMDIICDEIDVKAYSDIDLETPEVEISVHASGHTLLHGDSIFYLNGSEQITVIDSERGKKIKKICLKALESENILDNMERFKLLAFDGGNLFFILNEQRLFSIDLTNGRINKYAFYIDGEWTTFKSKYPVVRGNKIFIRDQRDRIDVFDLSK